MHVKLSEALGENLPRWEQGVTLATCSWHRPRSHLHPDHTFLPTDTAIALCSGDWLSLLAQAFKAGGVGGGGRRGVGWITHIWLWRHLANIRRATATQNINKPGSLLTKSYRTFKSRKVWSSEGAKTLLCDWSEMRCGCGQQRTVSFYMFKSCKMHKDHQVHQC